MKDLPESCILGRMKGLHEMEMPKRYKSGVKTREMNGDIHNYFTELQELYLNLPARSR